VSPSIVTIVKAAFVRVVFTYQNTIVKVQISRRWSNVRNSPRKRRSNHHRNA